MKEAVKEFLKLYLEEKFDYKSLTINDCLELKNGKLIIYYTLASVKKGLNSPFGYYNTMDGEQKVKTWDLIEFASEKLRKP